MLLNLRAPKADEDLMQLVQRGDERALTELYRRYSARLVRYFHRMLWRDEEKAQDFLHDLFVRVIEKAAQFDSSKKFSTWIYSAAFNMCKNEYRRQSIRQAAHSDVPADGDRSTERTMEAQEFRETLEKLLFDLEESDRNLFVLRYELELPLAEIALLVECPEGTVKSRLFYLKKKLALKLRAFDPAIN
jgi:RNA polymerase sigma-70 factor (ECF subfamily)